MATPGAGDLLLAGDIGGTNTDLAVVSAAGGALRTLVRRRFPSRSYPGLAEMARAFLDDVGLRVRALCADVPAPVTHGQAELTDLPWRLDERSLATQLGLDRAWLLNDVVATASAIPLLGPGEVQEVKTGEAAPGGTIAVLATGTGLGEAFLTAESGGPGRPSAYRTHASEGGHAAFSPANELELELLRSLWRRFDYVSVERVASGAGVLRIYEFLRDQRGMAESPEMAGWLAEAGDPARRIIDAAVRDHPDPVALATARTFLGILGGEAANFALKVLATGGLYVAGGIGQALRRQLGGRHFLDAFVRAGRFGAMLERVPVFVVSGDVALLGAASEGLRLLGAARRAAGPDRQSIER